MDSPLVAVPAAALPNGCSATVTLLGGWAELPKVKPPTGSRPRTTEKQKSHYAKNENLTVRCCLYHRTGKRFIGAGPIKARKTMAEDALQLTAVPTLTVDELKAHLGLYGALKTGAKAALTKRLELLVRAAFSGIGGLVRIFDRYKTNADHRGRRLYERSRGPRQVLDYARARQ